MTATGNAALYEWSTSETGESIITNPTVETEYIVIATCNDNSISSDTITIFVNPLPKVSLGKDTTICMHDSLRLSANSGLHYLWSNGSTENNITVSPLISTDYSLLLIDINNCQNSDTITININPLPILTICNNQEICSGDIVTLAVTTGAPTYFWNTGETTSVITVSPSETSNYIVTVIDNNKCQNTDTTQVAVTKNPIADFSFIESCEFSTTVFTDMSTDTENSITNWDWDFNDSNNGNNQNPNHVFPNSGVFDVQLIVTSNKNCKDTVIKSVQVFAKPLANFSLNSDFSCDVPVTLELTDQTTNATSWYWNFGNNETSTKQFPSTIYNETGQYQIQLIVESSHSCFDTISKYFEVYQKPDIDFSVNINKGCEPLTVSFKNESQYYDSTIWYIDNNFFFTQNNIYEFNGEGFYSVTLNVFNDYCSNIMNINNFIEVYNKPILDFAWTEETNPFPYGLIYFENYTQDANSYIWNFGDSIVSAEFEPEHRYDTYGDFIITQIAIDTISGCSDTLIEEIYVDYFNGLFVPNAFMPDAGVGEEKLFLPKGKHLTNYQILIYNNSGNLMWESAELSFGSPAEGWDGIYKGKPMPQGVYFWKINAVFDNNIKWKGQPLKNGKYKTSGFLTLIR